SLLGEILVRRGTLDVAAKALQRAYDPDPPDERTSRMLERARIRRPLDPPAPIPGETQPLIGRTTPNPFSSTGGAVALGSSMPHYRQAPGQEPAEPDEFEHDEGPTVVSLSPLDDDVPPPRPGARRGARRPGGRGRGRRPPGPRLRGRGARGPPRGWWCGRRPPPSRGRSRFGRRAGCAGIHEPPRRPAGARRAPTPTSSICAP